jgi:D-3-phosphoglycerate dehydrogenase
VHSSAREALRSDGYTNIDYHEKALPVAKLIAAVRDTFMVGIRSATQANEAVFEAAGRLIAVFNAPFSNTRSVAELVLSEIILLLRGIPARNAGAHRGVWLKSAAGSHEVRGKTLRIIGYGHIGTQAGLLAESLMEEVLEAAEVVTSHVPQTLATRRMIDGAALDVFPKEPESNAEEFVSPLRGRENVILTPHIGGSAQEAQREIGIEVPSKLINCSNNGSTLGAENPVLSGKGINIAGQYPQTNSRIGNVVIDIEAPARADSMHLRKPLGRAGKTIRTRILY